MEIIEQYSQFKRENPLKVDKWQPDAVVVVPGGHSLYKDMQTTFHSSPISILEEDSKGVVTRELYDAQGEKMTLRNPVINIDGLNISNREAFIALSQQFLKRGSLAETFFKFHDVCRDLGVDYAAVAGACTYYYWGGWPIYDIDVVVPSAEQLQKLANVYKVDIQETESGIGRMKYLNLGDVDALTDLELKYTDRIGTHRKEFSYRELAGDVVTGNLFGEDFRMAAPVETVLLKLYLGRFGVDAWGIAKDDYEDGLGVLQDQQITFELIEREAVKMGIIGRVEIGKKIAEDVLRLR